MFHAVSGKRGIVASSLRRKTENTGRSIAAQFEISAKKARRTLDFIRDRMRLPLACSTEHPGWHYTEATYGLHPVGLTEGDLVTILLTERLAISILGILGLTGPALIASPAMSNIQA